MSLKNGLKSLADALAHSKNLKAQLQLAEQKDNSSGNDQEKLRFIQTQLKQTPQPWLLIFDNVESFDMVKTYLPNNATLWGDGQVIITTRNSHISLADGVKKETILTLKELTEEEELTLFSRLRYKKEPHQLSPKVREETKEFLKNIPPFPLDVSISAKYIATYNVPYPEYLSQLEKQDEMFRNTQSCLLKETSQYLKTRYEIITLALKRVMQTNKAFTETLVTMSLVDPHKMPKFIFSIDHSNSLVDRFIHELKKYSIITDQFMPEGYPVFSIHRSTNEIAFAYMVELLKLQPKHPLIMKIKQQLATLSHESIYEENLSVLKLLAPHGERIALSDLLSVEEKVKAQGVLGCIYYYMRQPLKALALLEESLAYININMPRNKSRLGRLQLHLGLTQLFLCRYKQAEDNIEKSVKAFELTRHQLCFLRGGRVF